MKTTLRHIMVAGLLALGVGNTFGNPTGGNVASGMASISSAGKVLTVNQASNIAIINWQTFSIASGETTTFVQPSAASAVLKPRHGRQTLRSSTARLTPTVRFTSLTATASTSAPAPTSIRTPSWRARATLPTPISSRAIFSSPATAPAACRTSARSTPSAATSYFIGKDRQQPRHDQRGQRHGRSRRGRQRDAEPVWRRSTSSSAPQ